MIFKIEQLKREEWEGYKLPFKYETNNYYDVNINHVNDGVMVSFKKKPFEHTVVKTSYDKLFQCCWQDSEAYGVLNNNELIAVVEIYHERWNNRLRIIELWVLDEYRRCGIGKALMDLVKKIALEHKYRVIILETQSCNEKAIAFYLAQGFSLFGFDRSCYSNNDIENREVRIEMGIYIG